MQTSRTRHIRLSAVAMVAVIGLGAGALTADASSGSHRVQALGVPDATPTSSLPATATPGCATPAGCDLYAKPGTVDAGSHTLIPIWGFTTDDTDPLGGRLGGDPKNTIVISETDTLTINLHNSLPAGAGNLSIEIPAAQVAPDAVGVPVGGTATVSFSGLAPGTYVYEAGSLVEQARQLAMGLAAIIIVRPPGYASPANMTPYGASSLAFNDEALVVMNDIDPAFNSAPLTSDVEDYNPHYFFINGKAHPATDDIAVTAGDRVLLRAANLGIRDRALGLLNLRMSVIGDDSHQVAADHQTSVESKLLTPGQVADISTLVDPSSTAGAQFAILDLSRHLNNSSDAGVGGMLAFINVVAGPAPAGNSVAKVTGLSPATNDGTQNMSVNVTFSGGTTSAAWFLDTIDGPGHAFAAGDGATTVPIAIATVLGDGALTGDHVIWIQPSNGSGPGAPSGDVFTLALDGPTTFALTTDPQFANVSFNKVDANPPGSTDVVLTGSALPSLVDYVIDDAQACFTLPAPTGSCPSPISLDVADALAPSHEQALSVHIPVADFLTPNATNTVYVRVHEAPTGGGAARWSLWGDPNSTVDVVVDNQGPTTTFDFANSAAVAGIGNHPGNLNFLESIRIQVNIADTLSPIADAELFLDVVDADGTGSQLRPLAGQWLDDLTVHARSAYEDIPVSELLSRPQGSVKVYVHAKDAAGNWGPTTLYNLPIDKTNPLIIGAPVDVVSSHVTNRLVDETGNPVLSDGTITLNACDPNGVSAVGICPSGAATPPETNPVSSAITEIRYHVSAVTGTFGTQGAGVFYQTAQRTVGTITDNGNGTSHISFDWHLIQPSPVPADSATSVWVWVIDGAGNPSIPVEVLLGS